MLKFSMLDIKFIINVKFRIKGAYNTSNNKQIFLIVSCVIESWNLFAYMMDHEKIKFFYFGNFI